MLIEGVLWVQVDRRRDLLPLVQQIPADEYGRFIHGKSNGRQIYRDGKTRLRRRAETRPDRPDQQGTYRVAAEGRPDGPGSHGAGTAAGDHRSSPVRRDAA